MQVRFGTTAPAQNRRVEGELAEDGSEKVVRESIALPEGADHAVAEFTIPADWTLGEAFTGITAPVRGVWDNLSDAPPVWVSSDTKMLAEMLAEHYSTGPHEGHVCKVVKYDASIVTVFGDPEVAKPKAHRDALAAHGKRLGLAAAADEEG